MRRINMKKLKVKKGSTCMACLACVEACSEAFYKEFHPDKSCIQIVEKKSVRPMACPQCGNVQKPVRKVRSLRMQKAFT